MPHRISVKALIDKDVALRLMWYHWLAGLFIYSANIFRGRIEYEMIYSLRGAKHRVDYSVHIR